MDTLGVTWVCDDTSWEEVVGDREVVVGGRGEFVGVEIVGVKGVEVVVLEIVVEFIFCFVVRVEEVVDDE